MDRMLSMEVFVAVVEAGSFSAAANLFKITPAMVSKHIRALEKRLGATLLARTTRSQKLTEIGLKYYENCKLILGQVAEAEAGAEAMGSHPKGHLRVSASIWFGSLTLAPLVCDFLKEFSEVDIELSLTDRYVDIVEEGFDVAIRIGELKDSSLIARKLSVFEYCVCASPEYLAEFGTPKVPEDLMNHYCLDFSNWQSQGGWRLMRKQLRSSTSQAPKLESNNVQVLHTAALKGIGIIMMPKELLRADIASGRLVELMQDFLPASRPIHVVYPRERQLAPKLTSFVDFLLKELRA